MADNKKTIKPSEARVSNDAPILDVPYRDIGELLHPEGGRRQPMRGFQDDYVDFVHYIVKCTHDIWEKSGYGLIYTHYAQHTRVHTSDGMIYGRDKVIEDTVQNQAAFPNLRPYADDVIWSGDELNGFYSSHRVFDIGRNTGYSIYGPPTGRTTRHYVVADCFVKENRIVEEWIARDGLAIVRNLGLNEHEWARKLAQLDADAGVRAPESFGEVEHLRGQEPPPLEPSEKGKTDPENFMRRAIHEIWNWRLLNQVDTYYAPHLICYTSGNRTLYGRGDYRYNIVALLAAFPDALIQVDHTCVVPNGENGYRVAARWTLQGTHTGPGWYGAPTGKRVRLIGMTHSEIETNETGTSRVVREWQVYDEIALLKQILRPA
jgi:predicted ester cyclase